MGGTVVLRKLYNYVYATLIGITNQLTVEHFSFVVMISPTSGNLYSIVRILSNVENCLRLRF